jgi:hypothetical protein
VTGAQLLAALLREEGDAGHALRAMADSTLGGAKATWAVKKAATAGVSSSSGSGSGGGGKDGGAVPKLPEAVVSRLLGKAAARPTIRPLSGDAAAGAGGGACVLCGDAFHAITKRPQHCQLCGHQVCGACSSKRLPLAVPGSSGEAARVCDGCFTWGNHQIAAALAAEAERGNKEKDKEGAFSGPEAVARARQRREEALAAQAQQEAAEQKELFGAAAALGEKAMSWLRGGGDGQGDERRQRQQAAARVTGQMEEVRRGLEQRGERIENLADRTEELVNSSAQFAAMARQLNEQNKGWGGLW